MKATQCRYCGTASTKTFCDMDCTTSWHTWNTAAKRHNYRIGPRRPGERFTDKPEPTTQCRYCGTPTANTYCDKSCAQRWNSWNEGSKNRVSPPGPLLPNGKFIVTGRQPRVWQPQPLELRLCVGCEAVWIADSYSRKYCKHCKALSDRWRKSLWKDASGYIPPKQIARARRAGAVIERIDRNVVFTRDGWLCQLCGQPTNPNARPQDDMRPSIDHIVPLARGGSHTYDNLQTAHRVCNSRKGAR